MEDQLKSIQKTISELESKIRSTIITPKAFYEEAEGMSFTFSIVSKLLQSMINDTMTIPSKFLMQKILTLEYLGIISDVVKFNLHRSKTMSTFRQGKLSEYVKGELTKSLSDINGAITTEFEDDPSFQIPPEKRGYVEIPSDYKDFYLSQTKKYTFNKENSIINQIQFSATDTSSSRRVKYVAKAYGLHGSSASFSGPLTMTTTSSSSSSSFSSPPLTNDKKDDNAELLKVSNALKTIPMFRLPDEDNTEKNEKKTPRQSEKTTKKEKEKEKEKEEKEKAVKKEKKEGLSKIKGSFSFKVKAQKGENGKSGLDSSEGAEVMSRERVVNDLGNTERAYIEGLKTLITAYKTPLLHENHLITEADSDSIFGNLEAIYNLHEKLYKSLESDTKGDTIGKTLIQFFKSYTEYGKTYEKGNSLLHKLKKSNPEFRKFVEKVGKQYGNSQSFDHLEGLLITPIQRLPRYNVILNDLIACTDKEHPDYENLVKARDLMAQVSDAVSKSKFSKNKLMNIQLAFNDAEGGGAGGGGSLISKIKPLVQPHRELVLEADFVMKDKKSGDSSIHVILCNDVIVFTKKRRLSSVLTFVFCEPIGNCMASRRGDSKCDFSIQYGLSEGDNVVLEASSEEERNTWFNEINSLCKKVNMQYNEKVMRVVSSKNTEDEATLKAEAIFNQEVHFENMSVFDSITIEVVDEIVEMSC